MCPASMQRAKAAVQVPTAVDKYLCTYRPAATLSSAGRVEREKQGKVGGRKKGRRVGGMRRWEGGVGQLSVTVGQALPFTGARKVLTGRHPAAGLGRCGEHSARLGGGTVQLKMY